MRWPSGASPIMFDLGVILGIAKAVQVLKANSSRWMKEQGSARFEWQEGYFTCSVSKSQVATIPQYVVNQKDHHGTMDLAKEFKLLAKKHGFEIGIEANQRVVASPKGDLVSVAFLSQHSRAGLWILPSLPGLVCAKARDRC
jgi:hypothetical protein